MDAEPRHLNPMLSPSVWTIRVAFDTVFEPLIRYEPPAGGAGAGPGSYRPNLATSWSVSPNGRELRVELRGDATFHDGRRMTAVDVQFSIDSARHPRVDAPHLRPLLADVSSVEILSTTAVRIRLSRANGYVLRALAEVPILPEHVYERRLSSRRDDPMVGTGPYRLDAWDGDVVRLIRNDDYWGEAPAIPVVEFVHVQDAAAALTAAKRGELDILPALAPVHYPEQASAPAITASFSPLVLRPPVVRYIALGQRGPPFDDPRVRKAVALAVNRTLIIDDLHGGLARAVAGPVWPGGPGDGPAPAAPGFDLGGAAALLDAAGWRDADGTGARLRGSERLHVALLTFPGKDNERDLVVKELRQLGFVVEVRRGSRGVLLNRLESGEFDLGFVEWRARVDTDLAPLLETGGARNYGGYSDDRVDRLINALRSTWSPAERAPLHAELATRIAETMPFVPLPSPEPFGLIHRRVRGAVVWNGWLSLRALSLSDEP